MIYEIWLEVIGKILTKCDKKDYSREGIRMDKEYKDLISKRYSELKDLVEVFTYQRIVTE